MASELSGPQSQSAWTQVLHILQSSPNFYFNFISLLAQSSLTVQEHVHP